MCRDSKLVINSHVGKRTREDTDIFIGDLKARIANRFQFTTDGWKSYVGSDGAVAMAFGDEIDYATEVKYFAKPNGNFFEKQKLCSVHRKRRIGQPDITKATTCHMERQNLNMRLFNRRHTRLTLGYSKKLANLKRSISLLTAHFNFCRVHSSLKIAATEVSAAIQRTPAMAAGLTDHVWTVAELLTGI